MGNVLVQLMAGGHLSSLADARAVVRVDGGERHGALAGEGAGDVALGGGRDALLGHAQAGAKGADRRRREIVQHGKDGKRVRNGLNAPA